MNKLFLTLILSFIAFVKTPLGVDRRYVVESFEIVGEGNVYKLTLTTKDIVYTPVLFTIIEGRN